MDFTRLADDYYFDDFDETVEQFLVFLGIRTRMEFPKDSIDNFMAYFVDDHPTHWLVFMRFRGHCPASENGFQCEGLPKLGNNLEKAKAWYFEVAEKRTDGNVTRRMTWNGSQPPSS